MNRRDFLKSSVGLGLGMGLASGSSVLSAANYEGKFLFTVFAHGGWDPTSYCDPKVNVNGEKVINNWAKSNGIRTAGNIQYAPFANNEEFFQKHYRKMLVINGINTKTNSHTAGERYNKTGEMSEGHPSLAALYASIHNDGHLMPWITDGFRPYSGKLLAQTNLNGNAVDKFQKLVEPNNQSYNSTSRYVALDNLALIRTFREQRVLDRSGDRSLMLKQREQYRRFLSATTQNEGLGRFIELMNMADYGSHSASNGANKNVVRSLAAFAAGISLSADIRVSNFDTHDNHDERQSNTLTELNNAVDLLWEVAEQFGIADRLVVNIVSDFGRTNRYNDKGGKDHWSTTSSIIMERNPSWGNRVVGASDEGHHAQKVDFMTLSPTGSVSDISLSPNHVQSALRKYLKIDQELTSTRFSLAQNDLAAPLFLV